MLKLIVTDSFGVTTDLAPFTRANPKWQMFCLTQAPAFRRELFFLPPVLAHAMAGPTVEEVLIARDELANLGWAIKRLVETPSGAVRDRRWAAPPAEQTNELPAGERLRYRLAAEPPENWLPLVPQQDPISGAASFRRGRLHQPAQGKIVGEPPDLSVLSAEIPSSGVIVTRAPQWTRWIDGSSHLWVGRRKTPGNGEASSGMRFDFLTAPLE